MGDIKRDIFKKNRVIGESQQKVIFQQKKPLLNYELNLLQDISDEKFTDLTKLSIGNNYIGDALKVIADPAANPLTVIVKKGIFYHKGVPVVLADDVVFDNLIPTLVPGVVDTLCIEWSIDEIGGTSGANPDNSIVDTALGFETAVQQRVIANVVCLDNGSTLALTAETITFSNALRSITLQNGTFPNWLRIPGTKFRTSSLTNEGYFEIESSLAPNELVLITGTVLADESSSYTKFFEFDPLHTTAKQKEFVAYRKNFFPIAKINRSVGSAVVSGDIIDERDKVVYNFVRSGCAVSRLTSTSITVTLGEAFVGDTDTNIETVSFNVGVTPNVNLIDDSLNFIYVNQFGYVATSLTEPTDYHVMLAEVKVKNGILYGIEDPSLVGVTSLKAVSDVREFIPISWNFKYGDEGGTGETGFTSLILKFNADEAISKYNLIYLSSANGMSKASSNTRATVPAIGMATQATPFGELGNVTIIGEIENPAWSFIPGAVLYTSSSGAITATPPTATGTYVQRVGVAITSTRIYFKPDLVFVKNNPTVGEAALILLNPNGDLEVMDHAAKISSDRSSFLAPVASAETGSLVQTFEILTGRYYLNDSTNYIFPGATINMGLSGTTYKTTGIPAGYYNKAFFTVRDDLSVQMYEGRADSIVGSVLDPEIPSNEQPVCIVTFQSLGNMIAGDIYPVDQVDITDKRNWMNLGNLDNVAFKPVYRDDTHFIIQNGESWVNNYYISLTSNESILATTSVGSAHYIIYLDLNTASGGTALNADFVTMLASVVVDRRRYMPLGEYYSASSKITRSTFTAYSSKFWQFRDKPYSNEETFTLVSPASSFTLATFSFLSSDFLDVSINGVSIFEVGDYVKTPTNNVTLNYSAKSGAKVKIRKV